MALSLACGARSYGMKGMLFNDPHGVHDSHGEQRAPFVQPFALCAAMLVSVYASSVLGLNLHDRAAAACYAFFRAVYSATAIQRSRQLHRFGLARQCLHARQMVSSSKIKDGKQGAKQRSSIWRSGLWNNFAGASMAILFAF